MDTTVLKELRKLAGDRKAWLQLTARIVETYEERRAMRDLVKTWKRDSRLGKDRHEKGRQTWEEKTQEKAKDEKHKMDDPEKYKSKSKRTGKATEGTTR